VRASQVPEESQCGHALLLDPDGISTPGHYGGSMRPSATLTTSAPAYYSPYEAESHGLSTPCVRFATWVTPRNATLGSGGWPGFAGWDWLPTGFQ
jgi:hypothetical protein